MKILLLGIIVYVSKDLFFKIGKNWFEELKDKEGFSERVSSLRKNFWKGFTIALSVVSLCGIYIVQTQQVTLNSDLLIRLGAIVIALTAALGRGGWRIVSYGNSTVIERIDRGMYSLSQIGATVMLLLSLNLHQS